MTTEENYQKLAESIWILFNKLQEVGFDDHQAMKLTLAIVKKGN